MKRTYVILMRGINVGGKNKIPMAELKLLLEEQGFEDVTTYIQSGNVVLRSDLDAKTLSAKIENSLPKKFKLDSSFIRVLALDSKHSEMLLPRLQKSLAKTTANIVIMFCSSWESVLAKL